jgi:hypothetical protein
MKVIKPAALILLLAGISFGAPITHANGVSGKVTSGQAVTGTVTGDGTDSYTFNVARGTSFLVTVAETGTHDDSFVPVIDLSGPDGHHEHMGNSLGITVPEIHPVEGPWTVTVSRLDGKSVSGGGYQLTLTQPPFAAVNAVTSALTSNAITGTNTRGNIGFHTFTGVAGHETTVALSPTGGQGFTPQAFFFSPTGELIGKMACPESCEGTTKITAAGTYTVVMTKGDSNDVTGTYSISVQDKN